MGDIGKENYLKHDAELGKTHINGVY